MGAIVLMKPEGRLARQIKESRLQNEGISYPNFIRKKYHLLYQSIGQIKEN